MNTRILIGTVVGGLLNSIFGGLIFGLVLMHMIIEHSVPYVGLMKPEPDMLLLTLSNVFWGLLTSIVFVKWAKVYTFKKGMIVNLMVSIPISLAIDTQFMAFMNLYKDYTVLLLDVVGVGIMAAIVGGLMGWIFGKMGVLPE